MKGKFEKTKITTETTEHTEDGEVPSAFSTL